MNIVCIVQARTGSSRLPNKVLMSICNKTVLEHDIERLKRIKNINKIIIATTIEPDDIAIVNESNRIGIQSFRGSENDVLSRYYYAAKENNADAIVRVTSDCPLIDSIISENIIQFYIDNESKYDYVSNTLDRTFPRGLDTEVFSFKSLEKAFNEAKRQRDREHVTPYIWDNPMLFRLFQYKNDIDFSDLRWTLDTIEDFQLIERIYNLIYEKKEHNFNMNEVLNLYKLYPELRNINNNIKQKKV
jgi:spore coat polysaccharide biosynthesis protein SpsF